MEKEKRLSRPPSGQFSRSSSISVTIRGTGSSASSSNRDSVGTTDSSVSEEDVMVPPPLPLKQKEVDYCNISTSENPSFLYSARSSIRTSLQIKIPPPEIVDFDDVPPTPPPKPPKNKNI